MSDSQDLYVKNNYKYYKTNPTKSVLDYYGKKRVKKYINSQNDSSDNQAKYSNDITISELDRAINRTGYINYGDDYIKQNPNIVESDDTTEQENLFETPNLNASEFDFPVDVTSSDMFDIILPNDTDSGIDLNLFTNINTVSRLSRVVSNVDLSIYNAFLIPKVDDIFKTNSDVQFNDINNYPRFSLGFQHYYQQSRTKMDAVETQFEGRNKVYEVLNKFNINIDDHDKTLVNETKKYLNADITNSIFLEIWEILQLFGLIKQNTKQFGIIGSNEVALSVKKYREKFFKPTGDTYHENPTNLQSSSKIDLLLAVQKVEYKNVDMKEQESYVILLNEIIQTKLLNKDGNFVLKIDESFTTTTSKLYAVLVSLFDNVYIYKPLTSNNLYTDKYVICKGYLNDDKKIKILENMYDKITKSKLFVVNIFSNYVIPKDFLINIIKVNTTISNKQFEKINKIVSFVNKQNYRGDYYQTMRNEQIEFTQYWIDTFYKQWDAEFDTLLLQILEKNINSIKKLETKINKIL